MTDTLMLSVLKIAGSVALLGLVLWGVAQLARIAKLDPELSRKLIHISLGLYCLTFPYVFGETWEVAVTCLLAVAMFVLSRGRMRDSLGGGLHGVARVSHLLEPLQNLIRAFDHVIGDIALVRHADVSERVAAHEPVLADEAEQPRQHLVAAASIVRVEQDDLVRLGAVDLACVAKP